ncbi:MAG: cyclase family protein [Cyclobacteriaceae bacterium]
MRFSIYIGVTILLSACTAREKEEDKFEQLFNGELKVVDLTHTLSETSAYWPDAAGNPFDYDTIFTQASGAPGMGKYHTPEHYGTHIDAPIHSADNQPSVDQLSYNELFGPAVVIDVSTQCAANADYTLSVADLEQWESEHGPIPDRAVVLMMTGWSKKWGDYDAYKNEDENGQMHFPGFSPEAAQFLISQRNIIGIGIDDFSTDAAVANGFPVHGIVNGAGKFQLENVANLHELPPTGAYLINAPIKLKGGSGGQVRIFAIVK